MGGPGSGRRPGGGAGSARPVGSGRIRNIAKVSLKQRGGHKKMVKSLKRANVYIRMAGRGAAR